MRVKYIGEKNDPLSLMRGHIYECLGFETIKQWNQTFARVVDEDDDDYLYPAEWFEIVDK